MTWSIRCDCGPRHVVERHIPRGPLRERLLSTRTCKSAAGNSFYYNVKQFQQSRSSDAQLFAPILQNHRGVFLDVHRLELLDCRGDRRRQQSQGMTFS